MNAFPGKKTSDPSLPLSKTELTPCLNTCILLVDLFPAAYNQNTLSVRSEGLGFGGVGSY